MCVVRRINAWLDFRRASATLSGSLLGIAIAAWEQHARLTSVALGTLSIVVGALTVNAYLTRDRVEVSPPMGGHPGAEEQHNVHVLPPEN